jgi:hypothetical protein
LPKAHLRIEGVVFEVLAYQDKGLIVQILFEQFHHLFMRVGQARAARTQAKEKKNARTKMGTLFLRFLDKS